jgi:chromosome segregation ATPase
MSTPSSEDDNVSAADSSGYESAVENENSLVAAQENRNQREALQILLDHEIERAEEQFRIWEDQTEEIKRLRKELQEKVNRAEVTKVNRELQQQNSALASQIENLTRQLDSQKKQENSELRTQNEALIEKNKELTTQIQNFEREKEKLNLEAQRKANEALNDAMKVLYEGYETDKNNLREEINRLTTANGNIEFLNVTLKSRNQELENNNKQISESFYAHLKKFNEQTDELRAATEQFEKTLKAKEAEFKKKLDENNVANTELITKSTENNLAILTAKEKEFRQLLWDAEKENQSMREEFLAQRQDFEERIRKLEIEIARDRNDDVRNALSVVLSHEIERHDADFSLWLPEKESLLAEINELQKQIGVATEKKMKEAEQQLQHLTGERNDAYKDIHELRLRIINTKEETDKQIGALQAEKDTLVEQLQQKEQELRNLQEISKRNEEMAAEEISKRNEEMAKLQNEIATLQNQIREKNAAISSLEQSTADEVNRLNDQIRVLKNTQQDAQLQITALTEENTGQEVAFQKVLNKTVVDFNKKLDEIGNETVTEKQKHAEEIKKMRESHQNALLELQAAHDKALASVGDTLKESLKERNRLLDKNKKLIDEFTNFNQYLMETFMPAYNAALQQIQTLDETSKRRMQEVEEKMKLLARSFESKLVEYSTKIRQLQTLAEEQDRTITESRDLLETTRMQNADLLHNRDADIREAVSLALDAEISRSEDIFDMWAEERNHLNSVIFKQNEEIELLQRAITAAKSSFDEAQNALNQLNTEVEEFNHKNSNLQSQNRELAAMIKQIHESGTRDHEDYQKQLRDLTSLLEKCVEEKETANMNREEIQQKLREAKADFESRYAQFGRDISDATGKIQEQGDTIRELHKNLAKANEDLQKIMDELAAAINQTRQLESETALQKETVNALTQENRGLENVQQTQLRHIFDVNEELSQKTRQIAEQEATIDQLRTAHEELELMFQIYETAAKTTAVKAMNAVNNARLQTNECIYMIDPTQNLPTVNIIGQDDDDDAASIKNQDVLLRELGDSLDILRGLVKTHNQGVRAEYSKQFPPHPAATDNLNLNASPTSVETPNVLPWADIMKALQNKLDQNGEENKKLRESLTKCVLALYHIDADQFGKKYGHQILTQDFLNGYAVTQLCQEMDDQINNINTTISNFRNYLQTLGNQIGTVLQPDATGTGVPLDYGTAHILDIVVTDLPEKIRELISEINILRNTYTQNASMIAPSIEEELNELRGVLENHLKEKQKEIQSLQNINTQNAVDQTAHAQLQTELNEEKGKVTALTTQLNTANSNLQLAQNNITLLNTQLSQRPVQAPGSVPQATHDAVVQQLNAANTSQQQMTQDITNQLTDIVKRMLPLEEQMAPVKTIRRGGGRGTNSDSDGCTSDESNSDYEEDDPWEREADTTAVQQGGVNPKPTVACLGMDGQPSQTPVCLGSDVPPAAASSTAPPAATSVVCLGMDPEGDCLGFDPDDDPPNVRAARQTALRNAPSASAAANNPPLPPPTPAKAPVVIPTDIPGLMQMLLELTEKIEKDVPWMHRTLAEAHEQLGGPVRTAPTDLNQMVDTIQWNAFKLAKALQLSVHDLLLPQMQRVMALTNKSVPDKYLQKTATSIHDLIGTQSELFRLLNVEVSEVEKLDLQVDQKNSEIVKLQDQVLTSENDFKKRYKQLNQSITQSKLQAMTGAPTASGTASGKASGTASGTGTGHGMVPEHAEDAFVAWQDLVHGIYTGPPIKSFTTTKANAKTGPWVFTEVSAKRPGMQYLMMRDPTAGGVAAQIELYVFDEDRSDWVKLDDDTNLAHFYPPEMYPAKRYEGGVSVDSLIQQLLELRFMVFA